MRLSPLLSSWALCLLGAIARDVPGRPLVDLGYSKYQGARAAGGVYQFLGMRHAAPPLGNLRFRAPQDPVHRTAIQDASKFGPVCIGGDQNVTESQAEDCLFINVFTPSGSNRTSKLPVWVYIQGGGYAQNSNANYNGTGMVTESGGNIVLVNFNYRVGALGFLAGDALRKHGDHNVGLLDQRKALEWVQRHIRKFGGDPEHVVIHGASAGAGSVAYHLTAHGGREDGLFVGAISQSPYFGVQRTIRECNVYLDRLLNQVGCSTIACLRSADAAAVQASVFAPTGTPAAETYIATLVWVPDLVNWKLASNALSRPDQARDMFTSALGEQGGILAITLRYHEGILYLITMNADFVCRTCWKQEFVIFKTENPYDDAAWSGPITIDSKAITIDPDLFWDDDGKTYVASSGILLQSVDLETRETSEPVNIWNGTGGANAEGPHLYKKDGWYYLLIAEGGTEMNHAVTISRSKDVWGPYESFAGNPILTNRNTSEYFQTVGHADLFQDVAGNWWGLALSTRSGPEWSVYPMGRESVLFPAKWDKDEWPVLEPVRGRMRGPLPPQDRSIPGSGNWVDAGERLRFPPGSDLPRHLVHWRFPSRRAADYAVSPRGHPNTLALQASWANLTAHPSYQPTDGQTFIARRQSHTFFEFSVDVSAHLTAPLQETGISLFLTSRQHIDLGIIMLPVPRKGHVPHIQLNTVAFGKPNATVPKPVVVPLPKQWTKEPIRLQVAAHDDSTFVFSASTPSRPDESKVLGSVSGEIVSGGSGHFTGSLLGAYATTNGGKKSFKSYLSRWTYTPLGQKIDNSEYD